MKQSKKMAAMLLTLVLFLDLLPLPALAAGGAFEAFGGSGGGGGGTYHYFPDFPDELIPGGKGSTLSTIGGAGGGAKLVGGGGGEAGVRDGTSFSSGGAAGEDVRFYTPGAGGGTNNGNGGDTDIPGANGTNGGGGGGGSGNGGGTGGAGSQITYAMRQGAYDSLTLEGGHGGMGGVMVHQKTGGGGGSGGGGTLQAAGLAISGNAQLQGGDGGAGGDYWQAAQFNKKAGDGGSGGQVALEVTGRITVAGALTVTGGTKGADGKLQGQGLAPATPGTGGAGGKASLTAGELTASTLTFTANDGGVSAFIGTLAVHENTTLTVDGTAATDIVIGSAVFLPGKALTLQRLNGGALTLQSMPVLAGIALPAAGVGAAYSQSLNARAGGVAPFSFAVASGSTLPDGLTLAADGTLSGTPKTAATGAAFDVLFTDGLGNTARATFTLSVRGAPAPVPKTGDGFPLWQLALALAVLVICAVRGLRHKDTAMRSYASRKN